MKNKHPSHRRLSKKTKRSTTGIDEAMARFFVGGEWKIAGFAYIKPPRWIEEYDKMRVRELVRRIQDDLEELLARAYPTYSQEWSQKFAPNYWRQFPHTYEGHLHCVINESVAEQLCGGLWKRIISQDKAVSSEAREEYQRHLQQFLEDEPKRAAKALAFIAKTAATYLEHLFVKRGALMREVAPKYDLWPVNLGIRYKKINGMTKSELRRVGFARDYLVELGLNSQCDFPSGHGGSGSELKASPFRLAAEELYIKMLLLKDDSLRHSFARVTPWAKRLFALSMPMTKSNSAEWWAVARDYLYERWEKAQKEFKPLIKHLGFKYPIELTSKTPYESNIKSRVIDNGLKDAFVASARADL